VAVRRVVMGETGISLRWASALAHHIRKCVIDPHVRRRITRTWSAVSIIRSRRETRRVTWMSQSQAARAGNPGTDLSEVLM
jgi:hypothetical protein